MGDKSHLVVTVTLTSAASVLLADHAALAADSTLSIFLPCTGVGVRDHYFASHDAFTRPTRLSAAMTKIRSIVTLQSIAREFID